MSLYRRRHDPYSGGNILLLRIHGVEMVFLTLTITLYMTLANTMTSTSQAFILDHQLGMFACQASPSINSLSLYNISALCDGISHCFNGLDEDRTKLECKNDCRPSCVHGTCLKGPQCYCDCDWGGKDCNIPDVNECKNSPCHNMAFCTNTLGSFYCTCLPGFSGDGFDCKDIDECSTSTASPPMTSESSLSFNSAQNQNTMMLPAPDMFLRNMNGSSTLAHPLPNKSCSKDAKCFNVPGSYYCQCNPGYTGDGYLGCQDVDECLDVSTNDCGPNSRCINRVGTYECQCQNGFRQTSALTCHDIDECGEVIDPITNQRFCHINSDCINTVGGFACICKTGYVGNGMLECMDIDECSDPSNRLCMPPSLCKNSNGSYECACPKGYEFKDDTCTDIDECASSTYPLCGTNAMCVNLPGQFVCRCPDGLSGDPEIECKKMNECLPSSRGDQTDTCDLNSNCLLSSDTTYKCVCNRGFKGNGTTCLDINECLDNPSICSSGFCVNSIGAYFCTDSQNLDHNDNALETYFNGTIVIKPLGRVRTLNNPLYQDTILTEGPSSQELGFDNSKIMEHLSRYRGLHRTMGSNQRDFIEISCKADGIHMIVDFAKSNLSRPFNGILYVKGNFKVNQCRRLIMNNHDPTHITTFEIRYSDCAFDKNEESNEFSTIVIMQPHLKLLTYDARAYKVFCTYDEVEKTVSNDLNVSMRAPQQVLRASSVSPTCKMEVLDIEGKAVTLTDLGSKLQLKIWLLGGAKYGIRAKNCVAKTLAQDWEYVLVDSDGCSTDTNLFQDFEILVDGSIRSIFSAFKFPNSVYLRFKCEVKICLGPCSSPNCDRNGSRTHTMVKRSVALRPADKIGDDDGVNVLKRVESGLMQIQDKSEERFSYLEEYNDDYNSTAYQYDTPSYPVVPFVTKQSYQNTNYVKHLNRNSLDPRLELDPEMGDHLTCVSRFGLLTGLILTLVLAVVGGSGLAFTVKRQNSFRKKRKNSSGNSPSPSFSSSSPPLPFFRNQGAHNRPIFIKEDLKGTDSDTILSSSSIYSNTDVINALTGELCSEIVFEDILKDRGHERSFYNKAFSN